MARINNHLVIMAGGVGSRFWPMSTAECPKQFIDVLGVGKTLLQMTVERFGKLIAPENIWVVTNQSYANIVREQLPDMPTDHILCEPCRRNTAPCIAYVSWRIKSNDPKANIVVTPSDHIVMNTEEFQRIVQACMTFTADTDAIVTLGIKPTRPETGYGYIQADPASSSPRNKEIFRVDSFREKPDLKTAKQYISKSNYFWNAGIFIWNVNTIVNAFRIYQPSMSDLGTWGSLLQQSHKDLYGNACIGQDVQMIESHNCIVHTTQEKKVVVQGLDGYIVAEKNNTLLICKLSEEQRIKQFSGQD